MHAPVVQIPVGGFDKNFSYLVGDGVCVGIVDPSGNSELLFKTIEEQQVEPVAILVTHTHFDHIDRLKQIHDSFPVPIYVHKLGVGNLTASTQHLQAIEEGAIIALARAELRVLHTPGHNADAVCYYVPPEKSIDKAPHLITGDTLFVERVGRTTALHVDELYDSVQRLMHELPAETRIYPGHDYGCTPTATLAELKNINPYVQCANRKAFRDLRLSH